MQCAALHYCTLFFTHSSHFRVVSSCIGVTGWIASGLGFIFWKHACKFSWKCVIMSSVTETPSSSSDVSSAFTRARSGSILRPVPLLNSVKSCHSSTPLRAEGSAITATREMCSVPTNWRTIRRKHSSWILMRTLLRCVETYRVRQRNLINIHEVQSTYALQPANKLNQTRLKVYYYYYYYYY